MKTLRMLRREVDKTQNELEELRADEGVSRGLYEDKVMELEKSLRLLAQAENKAANCLHENWRIRDDEPPINVTCQDCGGEIDLCNAINKKMAKIDAVCDAYATRRPYFIYPPQAGQVEESKRINQLEDRLTSLEKRFKSFGGVIEKEIDKTIKGKLKKLLKSAKDTL